MCCRDWRWLRISGFRSHRRKPDPLVNSGVEVAGRNRQPAPEKRNPLTKAVAGIPPYPPLRSARAVPFSRFAAEGPSIPVDAHATQTLARPTGCIHIQVGIGSRVCDEPKASEQSG